MSYKVGDIVETRDWPEMNGIYIVREVQHETSFMCETMWKDTADHKERSGLIERSFTQGTNIHWGRLECAG